MVSGSEDASASSASPLRSYKRDKKREREREKKDMGINLLFTALFSPFLAFVCLWCSGHADRVVKVSQMKRAKMWIDGQGYCACVKKKKAGQQEE